MLRTIERVARQRRIRLLPLALAGLLLLGLFGPLNTGRAEQVEEAAPAPPGEIRFVGRNLLVKARGTFHSWRITKVEIDRSAPERGVVEIEIDIESIDTGIGRRDKHLRSDDFFDIERFPTARVRVHSAAPDGRGEEGPRYLAIFDVRIRNIEKALSGHFEMLSENPLRVRGGLSLDRVAFGVGSPYSRWNPLSLKQEIPIEFEAELSTSPPHAVGSQP